MRHRPSSKLLAVLSFLAVAGPLGAQAPQEEAQIPQKKTSPPGFGESLDVDLVNVDVYATDKKGVPVTGLGQDDFQVFEDEKKVKVTHFSGGAAGAAEPVSIVVYVDGTQLAEANRAAALGAIGGALEERMVAGGPPVMVVYFDGGMRMEQDFTSDRALVQAAIHRIEDYAAPPSETQALERSARNTVDDTMQLFHAGGSSEILSRNTMDTMFQNLRGYGEMVHRETVRSVDALTAFTSALGARPGRKAVFVVADGMAMRPLEQLVTTLMRSLSRRGSGAERAGELSDASSMQVIDARPQGGEDSPGVGEFTTGGGAEFSVGRLQQNIQPFAATGRFERLAAIANSSRVTFYPVRPPVVDASTTGLGKRASEGEGSRSLSDTQEGFQLLASTTGGDVYVGIDPGSFVRKSLSGAEGHYSLAFAPRDRTEGAVHTIGVKAKGGVKLRHRSSYVTKTGYGRLADRAVGALTLGWVENPHQLEIHLDKENRAEDGNWDVSIIVQFPIRAIELVAAEGVHRAQGKVAVIVLNSRGELSQPQFMDLPLQIPEADLEMARSQQFGARVNLRLPSGPQQVAIGLWDETAQTGSFISRELNVGSSS